MPRLPASAPDAMAGEPSRVAYRIVQLLRSSTQPSDFPASIVSGLSSTDPSVQQAAIAELRAYIKRLFFLHFEPFFFISNIAVAGIICLIIVIGFPVVLHRLCHGRLYPFRVERRAQGSYLVPNAINCFLLLEGVYGVLTVAFNFVVWQLFNNEMEAWVPIWQAVRSLIWIPLYMGAFLTGWGSFYTAPGALDKPTAARNKSSARGHLAWPVIVNLACWGVPVALVVSLLPPVCLSSVTLTNAYNDYKDWDRRFNALLESTPANTPVNQVLVDDFRSQAYTIFTNWTRSYYYIDIGYVIWGFWALVFVAFYVPAGGVLVYLLYRQVRRQKSILLSYQRKLDVQLAQEEAQTQVSVLTREEAAEKDSRHPSEQAAQSKQPGVWSAANLTSRIGAPLENIYEDRGASDESRGTGRSAVTASLKSGHDAVGLDLALRQEPRISNQNHGARPPGLASHRGYVTSLTEQVENPSTTVEQQSSSPPSSPKSPRPPSAIRKLMRLDTHTSSNRGGQNSTKSPKRKRISVSGGPMSRYRYLRRCLVNLLILYFGIISAACFFGAITIYLAAVEYEHALQGPDAVVKPIGIAGAIAAWVSAVFGALTIGSIIFRNFDNPQPEASQNSGEAGGAGGIRRRFQRNGSRTHDSGSGGGEQADAGALHEKTRTLPAVPESVDLEASMMSGLQSRPQMAMNTAMKFSMSEQTSRPGGFVIRPDDQLASTLSAADSPEMEDGPRIGHNEALGRVGKTRVQALRPPRAARAWMSREREATMSIPQDVTESFGLASLPMIGIGSDFGRSRQESTDHFEERHFSSNDTTLAAYPAFDPRVINHAFKVSQTTRGDSVPSPKVKQQTEASPSPPVLKRQSRYFDSAGVETPASKIAREWAQSQYLATPLPETPAIGDAENHDVNSGASTRDGSNTWVNELECSSPVTVDSVLVRPPRDARRLTGSPTLDNQRSLSP